VLASRRSGRALLLLQKDVDSVVRNVPTVAVHVVRDQCMARAWDTEAGKS
jgi:hypothetical protein